MLCAPGDFYILQGFVPYLCKIELLFLFQECVFLKC